MTALALLAAACSFQPSGDTGAPVAPGGGPDGGGGGVIGGDPGGDAGAAAPVPQVVTPIGSPTTVGDLGGFGGSSFTADCAAGHVVTGLDAEDNDFGLCRLRAVCSKLVIDGGAVEVIDPAATQSFGSEGSYYDIDPVHCPTGSALVGFEGSESGDGLIHHLRLSCAPIAVDGESVVLGAASEVPQNLGSPSSGGSGSGTCPAGQLAAGIAGRAGSILDRFQLRCYQVALAPAD